jgi:hypothetical protein
MNQLRIIFLLELSVDYPLFQRIIFKKSWIIHFLWIEVEDYPPLVGIIYFMVFIMSTSMEEVLVVLRNLEHENQTFGEYIAHLQTNQASTSLGCVSTIQP